MNPTHTQIKEKMRILQCLLGKFKTFHHRQAPSKAIDLCTRHVIFSHALTANFFCVTYLGRFRQLRVLRKAVSLKLNTYACNHVCGMG